MSNTNEAVATTLAAVAFTERFTFKTAVTGSPALASLTKLVDSGLLTDADLEEQKDDAGKVIGYKRKNFDQVLQAPALTPVLEEQGFTAAQAKTVQDLVQSQVAAYNKKHVVDEGKSEFIGWEQVLEAGLAIRKASSKVTTAMVAATTKAFTTYMSDVLKAQPQGVELAESLATKKFSVAACNRVNMQILERFSEVIESFSESLDAVELETHLSVLELWAGELEKTLNPEQEEMSIDLLGSF